MKTKLLKKIFSQFLLLSLLLITSIEKTFGAKISTWGPESPGGVPTDVRIPIINILNSFIFAPLLIIGLLFYCIYFYKRIRNKDKEKRKKWFMKGTVIICIDILLYIISIVCIQVLMS